MFIRRWPHRVIWLILRYLSLSYSSTTALKATYNNTYSSFITSIILSEELFVECIIVLCIPQKTKLCGTMGVMRRTVSSKLRVIIDKLQTDMNETFCFDLLLIAPSVLTSFLWLKG